MKPASDQNGSANKIPFRLPRPRAKARNAHAEYREAQRQRSEESASLAAQYPQLKSLELDLEFVNRENVTRTSQMKYSANPEHAKAVLVFACPTAGCVGGDFDLTRNLAEAVEARRRRVTGKICCQGQRKRASGEVEPCQSELHYTLALAYSRPG